MSIEVFDYRSDGPRGLNFFVTPGCRARFLTIRPKEAAPFHHHQLGQEVFVVMEGRGLFVIGDDEAVLGTGEACVARSGERHFVGPADENPVTLFLCVTPHIQPTHVLFDESGKQLADDYRSLFMPKSEPSAMLRPESDEELAGLQIQALEDLATLTEAAARAARVKVIEMGRMLADGDGAAAAEARDSMWVSLAPVFESAMAAADIWNSLTARTVGAPLAES